MSAPAVFSADYVDLRFVKSRKVAQIVVEIAIEQAAAFVAAFGTPDPSTGVPVALARIDPTKAASAPAKPSDAPPKERRRFNALPLPQQAAMRCGEPRFHRYLSEREDFALEFFDEKCAADFVRNICGVESRKEIVHGTPAGDKWRKLDDAFLAWLQVDA